MSPFTLHVGEALATLRTLPDDFVQTCVTSTPYWRMRDYQHPLQIGLEKSPEAFVAKLVDVFREVRRVLRRDGTLWLNIGDSYACSGKGSNGKTSTLTNPARQSAASLPGRSKTSAGLKRKDLVGIPWMLAFALRADGWYLRHDIIWHKPAPVPESILDRPTKAHEYVFLLSRSLKYFYNAEAIGEAFKDPRSGAAGTIGPKSMAVDRAHVERSTLTRPCPFLSCRYHLYLDVTPAGGITLNFPDLELHEMAETCALDVADRKGTTLEHVGSLMNVTRERIRQLESQAAARLAITLEVSP